MTTIDLLQKVGPGSAFPDCAGSVERSRVPLLHRDCKSKDSNHEKGSLCADHVKPPRPAHHSIDMRAPHYVPWSGSAISTIRAEFSFPYVTTSLGLLPP